MSRLLDFLSGLALRGPRPFWRRSLSRGGFMLLISLIAVAIGGLIMVSTSPDLSGAAASLKSRELSLSLATLRRAISVKPLYLTTTSFTFKTGEGADREYETGDYFTTEILHKKLADLQIDARSSGTFAEVGAGSTFLTTVPADPYIPLRDWYRPVRYSGDPQANPAGLFWGASYNAVKNPTFRTGTALEAYVAESLWIYSVRKNTTEGKNEIWRTDRFGQNEQTVVTFRAADNEAPALSPDGTRLAFQSSRLGGWDIFVVADDGSQEVQITNTAGAEMETAPIWSPAGDKIVFLKKKADNSCQLMVASAAGTGTTTSISVGPLDIMPTYDWSPDGRFIAYAYRRLGDGGNAKLALYDTQLKTHTIPPDGSSGAIEVAEKVKLAFSPNSNDLLYGTPLPDGTAAELWRKTDLRIDPVGGGTRKVAEFEEGPFFWADWIPDTVRPASNVNGHWVVYASGGSRFPNKPYLARQRMPASASDSQRPFLVSKTNPIAPTTVSLSSNGGVVAYYSEDLKSLYRVAIDGVDERKVLPVVPSNGTPAPVLAFADRTAFGATRDFWTVPPATGQLVTSANKAAFDANAWRAFVNSQADYDGDNRFGAAYLRISPPARQRHFLIDNGTDTFLIEDNPDLRGKQHNAVKSFLSKVFPTWSPRGLTFVGKKAKGAAGEPPVECFKEAVDVSATTVLITTGFDPALSPDDKWLAVSKAMSPMSTTTVPRAAFPLPDMDLWLSNAVGAPEPLPVHLTPDTPNAQERAPCWSPDGRYIYYQRETQEQNPFLGNHNSTIWRITAGGGANAEVVGNSACAPMWNDGSQFRSKVELYTPSVSPDGLRLAFIGRERILNTWGPFTAGDVIGEMVYVKDLYYNREPVLVLRSCHPGNPFKPPGPPENEDWGFDSLSWNPNGSELYAVRMKPIARRYPLETYERYNVGSGRPSLRRPAPGGPPDNSQLIRIVPKDPGVSEHGGNGNAIGAGFLDPHSGNYTTLFSNEQITGMNPDEQILNAKCSSGAYVYQRISSDRPILQNVGISSDVWYVLSGYVRTSSSANHFHRGQIMTQLFNNRGMLIPQTRNTLDFEAGLVDLGGPSWARFSAALRFDPQCFGPNDIPPYSMNLCLYSTSDEVGSFVEFTGLKLEKAFDQEERYPTAFSPDWTIFSASKEPDPGRPGYFLFER